MSHLGKFRVNKGLYGKKSPAYTNANMRKSKELLQVPVLDFDEMRRRIDFVLHIPDFKNKLSIGDMSERGIVMVGSEPKDVPETLDFSNYEFPILIVGAGFHDRKIVQDVMIQDLKMLLAQTTGEMKKRALEVLNGKK